VARSASSRPGRSLGSLIALIAVLYGVIGAGAVWSNAQWTPKLGLDLEGGTEIVMQAVPQTGAVGQVTAETMNEAVNIIRQRINGSGVSEAEITTQGADKIVVSLPGKTDQATKDAVEQAAALEFRAVLVEEAGAQPAPTASPTGSASPGASGSPSGSPTGSVKPSASATLRASGSPSPSPSAKPTASTNGMAVPLELLAATPTPAGSASASASASAGTSPTGAVPSGTTTPKASGSGSPSGSPTAQPKPTDASDTNWIDQALYTKFQALDCSKAENRRGISHSDPTKPLATCSQSGDAKYILGPTEVAGTDISNATAGLETNSQGQVGTSWEVDMTFTGKGAEKFAKVTQRLAGLQDARNQFAIVLDGLVVSAPRTNEAINTGNARITGNFDQTTSQSLANQLKFGALPISFKEQTSQEISATLGSEQLQRGLLAGLIGLGLVVLYSLFQYRALGLITIASLVIAGVVTYGLVALLGWRQGYRLSLPGVAGLIVSIGITADSFIVYFERIRDEVRDGRALIPAVESAWARARRTILISDAVSFLAALVLYLLAIGGVRGFAFTLGLTTVVDILVVFLFTHPMVALISRTRFFGGGHKLSGFDAEHLGRAISYQGRGAVRQQRPAKAPRPRADRKPVSTGLDGGGAAPATTGTSIAERRAAAERARQESLTGEAGGGLDDVDEGSRVLDPDRDSLTLKSEAAADAGRRDA